jgi:hypothetical protein
MRRKGKSLGLNYNDRPDGYGFGEAESRSHSRPYEKQRDQEDFGNSDTRDEYGMRNQYGPVDQYSFRNTYTRKQKPPRDRSEERFLRERYPNDDYSSYAGPDYREHSYDDRPFELGVEDYDQERSRFSQRGNEWNRSEFANPYHVEQDHPGVSGKDRSGQWLNRPEYEQQKNFIGHGPKNFRRSEARLREDVCEALLNHPDVDASDIEVEVKEGNIYLKGTVDSRKAKRAAEDAVEYIYGVDDVHNEIKVKKSIEGWIPGLGKADTEHKIDLKKEMNE